MTSSKSKSIINNFFWRFLERCGAQGVAFVVSIILARLLAPEVYGIVALVTVFTTILQVFVDSGFGNALIQKKDTDDIDFSTVFFFNIIMCTVLYIVIFFVSPYIARFYNDLSLTPIIRVLSLTIIFSGVKNVQQAYISRTMQFKKFFFATLGGTIGAAFVGITLAYLGFGIWALVAQQIFNICIDTLILWITVDWRPKRVFSFVRLKSLFYFGWKLLVSSLIETTYNNIRQLIIGRLYTSSDLAYYNRGRQFPDLIIANVNSSIDSVLLPVMSQVQDDHKKVKIMTRKAMMTSTYIMSPLMMGLVFTATPLVRVLLTEKWISCVPYMVIFCITFMFYPIHTANLNAIKAMGRSDIYLKLEVFKKILGIIILLCTMHYGVMIMAYSMLFSSIINQIINSFPNKKLLNYGYCEQLKDILPAIVLAVIMGMCVYPIQWIGLPDVITLFIQVIFGVVVYILGSIIFKFEAFEYLYGILKNVIKRKE